MLACSTIAVSSRATRRPEIDVSGMAPRHRDNLLFSEPCSLHLSVLLHQAGL